MRARGFTLIELLLVLMLIALLASLVTPVVTGSVQRAKDATLKENLFILRKAIDDYYGDAGGYPTDAELLVQKRYIRKIPVDPLTGRNDTWVWVKSEAEKGNEVGIIDVKSGSEEKANDGSPYRDW